MNRALKRRQAKQMAKSNVTPEIHQTLMQGMAFQQQNQLPQAEACYRKVLTMNPNQPDALQLLGLVLYMKSDLEEARKLTQKSLKINPEQTHTWYNLGRIWYDLKRYDESLEAYHRAIRCDANNAKAYYNRANLYTQMWEHHKAVKDYQEALKLLPDYFDAKHNLALTYQEILQPQKAIEVMREMVEAKPDHAQWLKSLAIMLRDSGDVKGAKDYMEKSLAIDPDNADTHYNYAQIVKYSQDEPHNLPKMEALLQEKGWSPQAQAHLHFGAAKAHEALKDYEPSAHHYDAANKAIRGTLVYQAKDSTDYFDRIMDVCDKALFEKHADREMDASEQVPIFIVGMMRSGTSLLEQMIASHSSVTGLGERSDLHYVITGRPLEERKEYLKKLSNQSGGSLARMGKEYLELVGPMAEGQYFTDKMPGNFVYAGMIHLMMPQAKIIHIERNAMDTCMSIYKRMFSGAHPYAYDQAELAAYYKDYKRLMAHWHEVLEQHILHISYETLIEQPEAEIKRVLEFCGLAYEPECLAFHANKRSVHTASATQVRKPIYKDAIDSWKPYTPYIEDLITHLGDDA